jgi:DNA-binding beta-propeller fold protein YncE
MLPRKTVLTLLLMTLVPLLALVAVLQAPALAAQDEAAQTIEVVATDLNNPRGLAFGPDGALYVAEAGTGGPGDCLPNPEGGEDVCYGETGSITRIEGMTATRIITGLASLAAPPGFAATGAHDVAFNSAGDLVIPIGLGQDPISRTGSAELENLGWLVTGDISGTWSSWVDIAQYEADENPAGGPLDSNPWSVLTVADGYIVSDAGANALLHVSMTGTVSTIAVFPNREAEWPPESGNMIPMEPVPTGVTVGPDGAYYVGELTGFPFPVGGANVWRVAPGEEPEVFASGFTNVVDVAFDADGNLYVLEIATNSLLAGEPLPVGALWRVTPRGFRHVVVSEGLAMPTGLTIGPDGNAYVSNFGIFADVGIPDGPPAGMVVRIILEPVVEVYFPIIFKDGAPAE